jgi:hypothetical protein
VEWFPNGFDPNTEGIVVIGGIPGNPLEFVIF